MATLDFDPDRVRALGTSLDTLGYGLAAADVDGNTDLVLTDLAGSLTGAMCRMVSDLTHEVLVSVKTDLVSVSAVTLHAVSEFTGTDETIATDVARAGQGVR
ncbi:hypothetical protein [Nocardia asteroides]|uniref:hypothetical protein n=1 Tax=Nocardia asteroides TaxID=1824 RepID=UPI001E579A4C|nr:hypothetical protein [Nocardia asteroides]UGT53965.1 hypothetical protein LTT85_25380 [Nocardia asteroides]